MKKKINSIVLAGLNLLPFIAFAQSTGSGITGEVAPPQGGPRTFNAFIGIFNTLINWLFTILLIAAVWYILLAAFKYLRSGGDAEKTEEAKNSLIYAAVALAVAFVAVGLRFIVGNLIGVQVTQ